MTTTSGGDRRRRWPLKSGSAISGEDRQRTASRTGQAPTRVSVRPVVAAIRVSKTGIARPTTDSGRVQRSGGTKKPGCCSEEDADPDLDEHGSNEGIACSHLIYWANANCEIIRPGCTSDLGLTSAERFGQFVATVRLLREPETFPLSLAARSRPCPAPRRDSRRRCRELIRNKPHRPFDGHDRVGIPLAAYYSSRPLASPYCAGYKFEPHQLKQDEHQSQGVTLTASGTTTLTGLSSPGLVAAAMLGAVEKANIEPPMPRLTKLADFLCIMWDPDMEHLVVLCHSHIKGKFKTRFSE
uniref:Peptidase S8/S53 domain-containing protein n=1 Tax=Macrostomum lignano TaxID=282301 RepID=A0A1I8FNZ5_9PLAT